MLSQPKHINDIPPQQKLQDCGNYQLYPGCLFNSSLQYAFSVHKLF